MKILVAKDDVRFLSAVAEQFRDYGHNVDVALSGLDLVIIMKEFQPDVLVMDQDFLGTFNDNLIDGLRDSADLSQIPVILLGDADRPPIPRRLLRFPLTTQFCPPFCSSDLVSWVELVAEESTLKGPLVCAS